MGLLADAAKQIPQQRDVVAPDWLRRRVRLLQLIARHGTNLRPSHRNGRRLLIVHLDGLSRHALARSVDQGRMPNLRALLERGDYTLTPAYAGAPASTPAFQAGLLWGTRGDIPGFLWYDKKRGQDVRMDRKVDARRVESEVSPGRRGLLEDGTAYFSLFDGGSCVNAWSLTGWTKEVRYYLAGNPWDYLALLFAHTSTLLKFPMDILSEGVRSMFDVLHWGTLTGRFDHESEAYKNRVLLSAMARAHATAATVLDIVLGVPTIYTCFADYDEVAHRRGPDSPQALRLLNATDDSLGVILAAVELAQTDYDIYLLSDHGQVATRPFEQLTGSPFKEFLLASLGEGAEAEQRKREVVCINAGDLAHIYFTVSQEPLDLDAVRARYGRLLDALVGCRGVGLVAARGGRRGYLFHRGKQFDLADPQALAELTQELPLGAESGRALDAIADLLAMPSAGDLVAYGNAMTDHDVAFSWEFGSHGGLAHDEVDTFVIHPKRVPFDFGTVEHASDLYRFFTDYYGIV